MALLHNRLPNTAVAAATTSVTGVVAKAVVATSAAYIQDAEQGVSFILVTDAGGSPLLLLLHARQLFSDAHKHKRTSCAAARSQPVRGEFELRDTCVAR